MVQPATFLDYMFPPSNLNNFSVNDRRDIKDLQMVAHFVGVIAGVFLFSAGAATLLTAGMGTLGISFCVGGVLMFIFGGIIGDIGAIVFPIIAGLGCILGNTVD